MKEIRKKCEPVVCWFGECLQTLSSHVIVQSLISHNKHLELILLHERGGN